MAITKLPSTASRAATRPAASRSCWPGVSSDAFLACCMTKWHFLTSNPLSLSPLQARQQEVLTQITNILKVVALDAELAHSHLEKAEAVSSYVASGGLTTTQKLNILDVASRPPTGRHPVARISLPYLGYAISHSGG